MRNVTRSTTPATLAAHATQWTEELLQWIDANPTASVPEALIRRYAQDDVREALRTMYRDQCCYCEGRIKDVSYDHIEHRRPKSKFRDTVFAWNNLHLACQKCNTTKGEKWTEAASILDAAVDSVEDHLTYETTEIGLLRWPRSQRGTTTVEHAGLNRDGWNGLPGTRVKVYLEALRVIRRLREDPEAPASPVVRHELEEKKKTQYGSVIAFALEEAGL